MIPGSFDIESGKESDHLSINRWCCCCTWPSSYFLLKAKPNAFWYQKAVVWILDLLLTPIFLVSNFLRIYVLPCFYITIVRMLSNLFAYCLPKSIMDCFCYLDKEFPPGDASLGNIQAVRAFQSVGIKWIRIKDLNPSENGREPIYLFDKSIEAGDIKQGSLGDCWILAALSALSERPEFIQNCFITRAFNPFGKYVVRLFDKNKNRFVHITVDDYVPCRADTNTPLFAKFNGQEMWPLLLEKAFAKFRGSFANIEGGNPLDALTTLTGYEGEYLRLNRFNEKEFDKLHRCVRRGCLMAAGTSGKDRTLLIGRDKLNSSIVGGHAYSILDIKTPILTTKTIRLLKIRNPWGSFEWKGDWSDESELWKKHKGVALEVGKPEVKDDGIFFMEWADFEKYFGSIFVLYPDYGLDNLKFKVLEEKKYCGTCAGLLLGTGQYWCFCRGLSVLWFHMESRELKHKLHEAAEREKEKKTQQVVIR